MAWSVVAVPATATNVRASGLGHGALDLVEVRVDRAPTPRARPRSGGSVGRARSVSRTDPICVRDRVVRSPGRAEHELGRPAADIDQEEGPVGGIAARASRRGTRARPPPRRRSPRGRSRLSRGPASTNSSRFDASRTALVAAPTRIRSAPSARARRQYRASTVAVRAIAPGSSRPVASTPCPSSVITMSLRELAADVVLGARLHHEQPARMRALVDRRDPSARSAARVDRLHPLGHPRPTTSSPPGEMVRVVRVQALDAPPRAADASPRARRRGASARARRRRSACARSTASRNSAIVVEPFVQLGDRTLGLERGTTAFTASGHVSQNVVGNGSPRRRAARSRITSGCPVGQRATTVEGGRGLATELVAHGLEVGRTELARHGTRYLRLCSVARR